MTADTRSSWETESGLLDNYQLTIEEAWFGPDEESDFDAEKPFLWLRGTAVEEDGTEHEEHNDRYSLGSNWEVVDEGEGVENAAGRRLFNPNTGIGWLVRSLVAIDEDTAKALEDRGDPYRAKTFVGLVLAQERRVLSTFKDDDGNDRDWELPLPTAVEFPKAKKSRKSSTKTDATDAKPTRRRKAKKATGPPLVDDIVAFASEFEAEEHDEFVDQVLDPDTFDRAAEIEADEEVKSDVLDEDGDIWGKAH